MAAAIPHNSWSNATLFMCHVWLYRLPKRLRVVTTSCTHACYLCLSVLCSVGSGCMQYFLRKFTRWHFSPCELIDISWKKKLAYCFVSAQRINREPCAVWSVDDCVRIVRIYLPLDDDRSSAIMARALSGTACMQVHTTWTNDETKQSEPWRALGQGEREIDHPVTWRKRRFVPGCRLDRSRRRATNQNLSALRWWSGPRAG
jgi:hypothetical protein